MEHIKDIVCKDWGGTTVSVLGPLIFLLYINHISQSIVEAFINMFAVDASLYTMGTNFKQVNDNLLNNVTNVHDWYTNNNKLAVHVPKTKVMLVTKKNTSEIDQKLKMSITLNGHTLEQLKSRHYLGVDVDENLTWEIHIKNLTRVLSYILYIHYKAI